jgi:hypothetical protein
VLFAYGMGTAILYGEPITLLCMPLIRQFFFVNTGTGVLLYGSKYALFHINCSWNFLSSKVYCRRANSTRLEQLSIFTSLTKQLWHWKNSTWLYVESSGNKCLMSYASVYGQLTTTVNMTTVCLLLNGEYGSDKRQIIIHIVHSKLQFPSEVSKYMLLF